MNKSEYIKAIKEIIDAGYGYAAIKDISEKLENKRIKESTRQRNLEKTIKTINKECDINEDASEKIKAIKSQTNIVLEKQL